MTESSSDLDNQENCVPDDILESAKAIKLSALPSKSKALYMKAYNNFMAWKEKKKIGKNVFSEDVMLVYFGEIFEKFAPSTIWTRYSMIRSVVLQQNNVDVGYANLVGLIKKNSVGFRPKQAKTFEGEELQKFLQQMDDWQYLAAKVIAIFGIYGATRTCELVNLQTTDVVPKDDIFIVNVGTSKTDVDRTFNIEGFYVNIVRKYRDLWQKNTPHNRFFVNCQMGQCTVQPIGKHKFESTEKTIASLLQLDKPEEYTGHSFRRTGTALAVEGGVDFMALKQHILEEFLPVSANSLLL